MHSSAYIEPPADRQAAPQLRASDPARTKRKAATIDICESRYE